MRPRQMIRRPSLARATQVPCGSALKGCIQSTPYVRPLAGLSVFCEPFCEATPGHNGLSAFDVPIRRRFQGGICAIAMFVSILACPAASAGPPFLTDDPEPVAFRYAEINLIGQQTRAAAGIAGSGTGEVNIGCAAETQCHIAVPLAFDQRAGGRSREGLGDIELGVKHRFLNRSADGWSAAVYPTFVLPTGDAGRGLGNGRVQLLLPLWVQLSSGPWSWDAGAARLINRAPAARDSWFTGLLGRRSVGHRLSLGAELFHRSSTAAGEPPTTGFNVGAIVKLASQQNLLISAGRSLARVEASRRSLFLAYQLEL